MKKLLFFIILLMIPTVIALDECERIMFDIDIPCLVLLPNATDECSKINITFFKGNTSELYTQTMGTYTPFFCNVTFNQTAQDVYAISYTTGDTGTITVTEDKINLIYLYIIAILAFFIFLGLGAYLQESVFVMISGFISCIIALNLFTNGFPNLTSVFLQQSIIIVLSGIGFYLILLPPMDFFENFKSNFKEDDE